MARNTGSAAPTTVLQQQARALGDPTRHEIFRYVADTDRPVDIAELTAHLGLNHNAIRQHLAKLVDAGLVVEEHAPSSGRGRPRLVYRVHPGTESRWGVAGPYERISVLLAEMTRTGDAAVDVGRRSVTGRARGRAATDDPVATVVDAMARRGLRAHRSHPWRPRRGRAGHVSLRERGARGSRHRVRRCTSGSRRASPSSPAGGSSSTSSLPTTHGRAKCRLRLHLGARGDHD